MIYRVLLVCDCHADRIAKVRRPATIKQFLEVLGYVEVAREGYNEIYKTPEPWFPNPDGEVWAVAVYEPGE